MICVTYETTLQSVRKSVYTNHLEFLFFGKNHPPPCFHVLKVLDRYMVGLVGL